MNATKQHYYDETEHNSRVYGSDALHQMTTADLHDLADSLDVDPELKSKQEKITAILDKQATSNQHPVTNNQQSAIFDTRDFPILFDKEMVQATLSGAKTATRRLFKSPLSKAMEPAYAIFKEGGKWIARLENGQCYEYPIICPWGKPGDMLWIKETFSYDTSGRKIYRASHSNINDIKWTPSIHMFKHVARIWLQITDIYPQRIQTVTEEEARQEGTKVGKILNYSAIGQVNFREGFFLKWISIYGIERFYENQWVWAIKYKMI